VKLTDTHCHLNFSAFDEDRDEVLERAKEKGVKRILVPGIDLLSCFETIALAEKCDALYSAVGVHPNSADTWNDGTFVQIQELSNHPKVVAIGEIGLDYFRDRVPKKVQMHVFQDQLFLAAEVGLPVVIHTRNADDQDRSCIADTLDILRDWVQQLENGVKSDVLTDRPGVMHSFSGTAEEAQRATDGGFFIGINGRVTYNNAQQTRHLVRNITPKKMIVETDSPFLTPHPHRGSRNEPAHVALVAEMISKILLKPYDMIADTTTANAEMLFKWKKVE
jgi:TatD DNase family protein